MIYTLKEFLKLNLTKLKGNIMNTLKTPRKDVTTMLLAKKLDKPVIKSREELIKELIEEFVDAYAYNQMEPDSRHEMCDLVYNLGIKRHYWTNADLRPSTVLSHINLRDIKGLIFLKTTYESGEIKSPEVKSSNKAEPQEEPVDTTLRYKAKKIPDRLEAKVTKKFEYSLPKGRRGWKMGDKNDNPSN